MDVSREQPQMIAGLDLVDRCSYLCLSEPKVARFARMVGCIPP